MGLKESQLFQKGSISVARIQRRTKMCQDYRTWRDPLRTPVQPKRPKHAPEPAPELYRRYGALQDEVPERDMEWDLEDLDGDLVGDFGISPAQGSASQSRREARRTWKAYAEKSLQERTWRSRGAAAWTSRRRWMSQPWEPTGDAGGNLCRPATGLRGLYGRRCRRVRRPEGHQAPHVRWEPPNP